MPKHTPKPWQIDETEDTYFIAGANNLVCQIEKKQSSQPDPKETKANAHLIASAPEMFDLYVSMQAKLHKEGLKSFDETALSLVFAAIISKAKGAHE